MTKEEKQKMRKNNMRIFPMYKRLAYDYLFFYTINFLFLTQIKGISAANVMLESTFYAFFSIIMQLPANIVVEFLGRKNSLILGNVLSCVYVTMIMFSNNLFDLALAEFFSATAFALKGITEPTLLNESIPPSRYKSHIYSKINSKGMSGYYLINAISTVIAGCLFVINGYLPMVCALIVTIVVSILSMCFIEPVHKSKKNIGFNTYKKQMKELKDGFKFIIKSERLKALILSSSMIYTLVSILATYYVSLQEDIGLSSVVIGVIAAVGGLISAFASKGVKEFHHQFRNKSLTIVSMLLSISTIVAGVFALRAEKYILFLAIVIVGFLIYNYCAGMYYTIIDKYLRNFSNEKIDTKIFAYKNLFRNLFRTIGGLCASFLLEKTTTAYCMIIMGIIFTIIYILMKKYMKTRVGLKPNQYSKEETKYDELKALN